MKEQRAVLFEQIIDVIGLIEKDVQKYAEKIDEKDMEIIFLEIISLKHIAQILLIMNKVD